MEVAAATAVEVAVALGVEVGVEVDVEAVPTLDAVGMAMDAVDDQRRHSLSLSYL